MTKAKQINIARLIYDAYPNCDLLPIDHEQDCRNLATLLAKVTSESIGDSLFRFIVVEIVEGGEGTMDGAIRVMERAKKDVEAVLQALQAKKSCRIDRSQKRNGKIYCTAAEYLAAHGRRIFTGHMNGGLWNARCMDAYRLSKKQNDKAAYKFLLKFGDQYALGLCDGQKSVWQKIKERAAAMLNPATS